MIALCLAGFSIGFCLSLMSKGREMKKHIEELNDVVGDEKALWQKQKTDLESKLHFCIKSLEICKSDIDELRQKVDKPKRSPGRPRKKK